MDLTGEVGHEDECALQHAYEQEVPSAIVLGDLLREVRDLLLDLLRGDEDALDVFVDVVAHRSILVARRVGRRSRQLHDDLLRR